MRNKIAIRSSDNIEENKEIIKIFENLGGENRFLNGKTITSSCYYIREDNVIECSYVNYYDKFFKKYKLYTLKEYKKEFMENKELKVTPPEGYIIDEENSTFEKIVFKKVEEKLTYGDIAKKLFTDKTHYYTNTCGTIHETVCKTKNTVCFIDPNNAPTYNQLRRLLEINKLMNIAHYLNDGWKPNWKDKSEGKYCIIFNGFICTIENNVWANHGGVVFKSMELAEQAIEILGEENIKLALGVL